MDFLWILSCFFAVTVAEDFNIFAEPYSPEKYTNRRCCVAIQMIEAMRNGFNLFPYESAIRCEIDRHELFTQNQYEAMGCYDGLISRHKRNIVNPNGPNANLLWTNPQNIPYKIKPGFTDEQIASIRQGMALIEEKTCIQFKEKDYSEVLFDHHIEVMYQDATCLSFVGMIGGSLGTAQQAQPIFLSAACLDFVKASHQFMHALGMWHENQRPDRDTYVKVDLNLIIPEERGNVVKLFPSLMTTLDTPYDYDSVMHAHPYENANGIDPPITTIDPRYQNRIGQRVEISFYNYYHLNQIYCKDTCGIIQPIRPCQNGGYQNPKKCTECLCKDGFGDVDCSKIAYDAGVMCPPDEIQMTGTGQVITSPGYDDAGSCDGTDKGCYPNKQRCTTLLKASPGNKVRVSFEGDFGMYCNMFGTLGTCYHWLEIRLGPDLTEIGERVCCYNTPSKVFVSEGEEILLLMRTNYTAPADKRRGFKLIAQEAGACDSVTCQNGGTCQGGLCTCADPYFGLNCENKQDFCAPNPCQNGGTCTDVGLSFVCECFPGLFGDRCELGTRDYCDPDPCNNNGVCVSLSTTFRCDCFTDYTGTTCDQQINQCASNPCINGGICIDGNGRFDCQCVNGYTGDICQFPPNTGCDNNPCATGATCVANGFSYTCTCPPGKEGTNCDRDTNECIPNPCIFGTCVDDFLDFDCVCRPGWEGRLCDQEIVDPCDSGPCQNGGLCNAIDDGTYTCTCQNGWMGDNCDRDIDECASTPCQNGGYCINGRDKYECFCFGSTGTNCENDIDECASNPCQNGATCNNLINMYTCTCVAGTRGTNCQTNVDDCSPNPCQNGGVCNDLINGYRCTCPPGTAGTNCETDIDDCSPNPCQNGGACIDRLNGYDYIDDCSPNPCQNGGACIDRLNGYDCDCLPGTAGDNCELNANDCNPNPCQNGGTCTDRINGYQCTCPAGTEGINCQINIDDCNPSPCQNGGVCIDLLNAYRCICPDGTQGFNCETNVDECNSNPCQNEGTCFDNVGGYECLCLPGTGGKNCENDAFDDCTPNPCQNNGQCVDKIGGYDCICPPGTNGNNCQINLDECASGPCLNGGTCVDGLNIYSCQCASGYSGVHCEIEDYVDPCLGVQCENGGQCVDENGVAICQCLPGYTREFCQTEVNECESQPCLHQGTCTDRVNGYECTCATGYSGVNCEIVTTDPCDPHPCNLGQCYSWGQIPFCFCPDSYEGRYCEILKTTVGTTTTSTTSTSTTTSTTTKKPTTTGRPAGLCGDKPCLNGGTCEDEGNKFSCRCPEPFFGPLCEENKNTANCGACREHLGMSQRPCYSEKRIPFRQRYIVRNIEDYCYMFLGHRICEYRTEQMCLKEYYERTPFCCGDTRYGTAELTGNINGYETCRVHGFSEFSSCQRYGHYGRQRMRYRSEFTYYTYTDYRCDPPYPIKMACTYTNWYNC